MADATFDAVIIGGGNKGLVLAMYLAKYGGMSVGVFEKRHEAGGGWSTEEAAVPGFLVDMHAHGLGSVYTYVLDRDFPEWVDIGVKYIEAPVGGAAIFKDDDSCIVTYNKLADQNYEKTAESIAKHSKRDAETWTGRVRQLRRKFMPAVMEWVHTPAKPPEDPDAMERLILDTNSGFDPSWAMKTPYEVLRDLYESDAVIAMMLRDILSWGFQPDVIGWGWFPVLWAQVAMTGRTIGVVGGTHNLAHAAVKVFLMNGGKIFTEHEVDRITIENGKAKGILLADGTRIEAKKMVISTLDPHSLCFKLIGKEHLSWQILRRVEKLESRYTCITWYYWALHEHPKFTAESINPDINRATNIVIVDKDPEAHIRQQHMRRLGIMPHELQLQFSNHSLADPTRAPEGKSIIMTEQFILAANMLSEAEWMEYKKVHAEEVMSLLQAHSSNMSWDNVIGYAPLTPYDHCRLDNMAPYGNWGVIDCLPSQIGRLRPIPELSRHRTPVENLYATGTAWHPWGQGSAWHGYNCYKIIAEDYGLDRPWDGQRW